MASELNRAQLVKVFNTTIFSLLDFLKKNSNQQQNIERVTNLAKVAKRIDHEILITTMGPYVLKYQDLIKNRNIEAFNTEHMEKEVRAASKDSKSSHVDKNKEIAMETFNAIYEIVGKLSDDGSEFIYVSSDKLIDTYIDFCIRCRTEDKK